MKHLLSLIALGLLAACSNTTTIQAHKFTFHPAIKLDKEVVLTQNEEKEIKTAIADYLHPKLPTVHHLAPLHKDEGGGVLAMWFETQEDPDLEEGYFVKQGALVIDRSDRQWVVRQVIQKSNQPLQRTSR